MMAQLRFNTGTHEATTLKVSDSGIALLALTPDGKTLITHGHQDLAFRRTDLRTGASSVWAMEG